jgi:2'-hydroxyisoflavone reductase
MSLDRRRFLTLAAGTGLAGAIGCATRREPTQAPSTGSAPAPDAGPPPAKSILVLGGTGFLGPHIVDAARARGHRLTLFNRGKTNPGLFAGTTEVEILLGDRDGKLEALAGKRWDAVVDTSGYVPRLVRMSAELLAPSVGQYVFISTVSVYPGEDKVGMDETAPTAPLDEPASEDIPKYYGALKAACERAAEAAMPGRVTSIRPGLIVGPLDPTGRYTHWVTRFIDGGEVLAPGDGTTLTQCIDGRDLAEWIVTMIEGGTTGVFNALGPERPLPFREVVETAKVAAGSSQDVVWVAEDFLEKQGVQPWSDLPMWIPAKGEYAGFGRMSNQRAIAAGLRFRPIADTARDTHAWVKALPADAPAKKRSSGISRDREAAVIAAWKARK